MDKNPNRTCCDDGKCYRHDVINKLESEFNIIEALDELEWGYTHTFVFIEDKLYYYKPKLISQIAADAAIWDESYTGDFKASVDEISSLLNQEVILTDVYSKLDEYIRSGINGMPTFIEETESFLVFADPKAEVMPVDEWKNNLLNIKNSFSDDINPLLEVFGDNELYIKGNQVYCYDILAFENNTNGKLGVFSEADDKIVFSAFGELDPTQAKVVDLLKEL
jgi:hypothetical protein